VPQVSDGLGHFEELGLILYQQFLKDQIHCIVFHGLYVPQVSDGLGHFPFLKI
jgi:hypothetical protein